MSIFSHKKNGLPRKENPLFLFLLLRASTLEPQNAVRDDRRKDKPKSRQRDDCVGNHRTHRSRARKNRGNEIEVEEAEKSPVQSTDDYQNIRNNISNTHNLPS